MLLAVRKTMVWLVIISMSLGLVQAQGLEFVLRHIIGSSDVRYVWDYRGDELWGIAQVWGVRSIYKSKNFGLLSSDLDLATSLPTKDFEVFCATDRVFLLYSPYTLHFSSDFLQWNSLSLKEISSSYPGSSSMVGCLKDRLVAVISDDTPSVYVSESGDRWLPLISLPSDPRRVWIKHSGIAILTEGGLILSPDLNQWVTLPRPPVNVADLVVAGRNAVAVAQDQSSIWMFDPVMGEWKRVSSGWEEIYSVGYGRHGYVAVSSKGVILHSVEGKSWMPIPVMEELTDVRVSDENYVAYGSEGVVVSRDGRSWRPLLHSVGDPMGLAFGNGAFVAVFRGGWFLTSTNGLDWSLGYIPNDLGIDGPFGVSFAKDRFFAFGSYGTVWQSKDGFRWVRIGLNTREVFTSVTYGSNLYLMTGSWGSILVSKDGKKWSFVRTGTRPGFAPTASSVSYGNGLFVVGGSELLVSRDGNRWSKVSLPIQSHISAIAFGRGTFVAVGANGNTFYSTDGTRWITASSFTKNSLEHVSYGDRGFVAVGKAGTVRVSINGQQWHPATLDVNPGLDMVGSAFGNKRYVLLSGNSPRYALLYVNK